jgi:hypothetical protein
MLMLEQGEEEGLEDLDEAWEVPDVTIVEDGDRLDEILAPTNETDGSRNQPPHSISANNPTQVRVNCQLLYGLIFWSKTVTLL